MKTQVDIVTGLSGSGKTTFINSLLKSHKLSRERIVVLQCEAGEEQVDNGSQDDRELYVENAEKGKAVSGEYIKEIIDRRLPERLIIEHDGLSGVGGLLRELQDLKYGRICNVNKIFHIVDSGAFEVQMNDMGPILAEQIKNSNMIIANNIDDLSLHRRDNMFKALEAINSSAPVMCISNKDEFGPAVEHERVYPERPGLLQKPSDRFFLLVFALIALYLLYAVLRAIDMSGVDLTGLQVFNTIFISILVQAFPFILFGVFISSIIQVFISQEAIVKFFPRNKVAAFFVAVVSGFFLPVCDCAIVPVAGRLVKKGVPLPVAVTFMLAAPIVNPVVIASTFYAFPGNPSVAFYRIYLGITVAVAVGLTFMFFPEKEEAIRSNADEHTCGCGHEEHAYEGHVHEEHTHEGHAHGEYAHGEHARGEYAHEKHAHEGGIMKKITAVFMHASEEFFEIGRFLIVGAFLSTLAQTLLPKEALTNLGSVSVLSLLIMMASAFLLSICSTSDAFIARTFTGQFPIGSVMGFLVLGPMIDIKNLLMLLGNFKKRFVIKLVFSIFGISFVVLYTFSLII